MQLQRHWQVMRRRVCVCVCVCAGVCVYGRLFPHLHSLAMCCRVLQCLCCSVLQSTAVCCSVLQSLCCSVLQCLCCSVLQCLRCSVLQCLRCSVLQCLCCSVLKCVAVHYRAHPLQNPQSLLFLLHTHPPPQSSSLQLLSQRFLEPVRVYVFEEGRGEKVFC